MRPKNEPYNLGDWYVCAGFKLFGDPKANLHSPRIYKIFSEADAFWRQYVITLKYYNKFPSYPLPPFTIPTYLTSPMQGDSSGLVASDTQDQWDNPVYQSFFKYNEDPAWITVFFIPGDHFKNSPATALTMTPPIKDANGCITGFRIYIFLTDQAEPIIFAHEIGHALFTRAENCGLTLDNPGPPYNGDPTHDSDQWNLMYGGPVTFPHFEGSINRQVPYLQQAQFYKATSSPLINCGLPNSHLITPLS
ncbi:hypothetical protein PDK93_17745 [Bacillus cereus]|nr:hypothetical protein [Bacillus cereus]